MPNPSSPKYPTPWLPFKPLNIRVILSIILVAFHFVNSLSGTTIDVLNQWRHGVVFKTSLHLHVSSVRLTVGPVYHQGVVMAEELGNRFALPTPSIVNLRASASMMSSVTMACTAFILSLVLNSLVFRNVMLILVERHLHSMLCSPELVEVHFGCCQRRCVDFKEHVVG